MNAMSLLDAMTDKLRWQSQRQDILAQNVANADTPDFHGQELEPVDFGDALDDQSLRHVTVASTNPMDILPAGSGDPAQAQDQASFEVTPEGNGVTVEDEMMKVTANQMDFQAVATLYTKSLALIRSALGTSS
jgi:flagellar basal-body rod protein FlgB